MLAVKKDRVLRGNGTRLPPEHDLGSWTGSEDKDILEQAKAIKNALSFRQITAAAPEISNRRSWWDRNQWWAGPSGLVFTLVGAALSLVGLRY